MDRKFATTILFLLLSACVKSPITDQSTPSAISTSPSQSVTTTPSPSPQPTPTEDVGPKTTLSQTTALYSGPGQDGYHELAAFEPGTTVILEARFGDFVRIQIPSKDMVGYVPAAALGEIPPSLLNLSADDVPWKRQEVVNSDHPLVIENKTPNVQHYPIVGSAISASDGDIRIELSIEVKRPEVVDFDSGDALYFENVMRPGISDYKDMSSYKAIILVYQNGTWDTLYQSGNEYLVSGQLGLYGTDQRITLNIPQAGDSFSVYRGNSQRFSETLPDSLYDPKSTMGMVLQVNAGSRVTIRELRILQEPSGSLQDAEPDWIPLRELADEIGITMGAEISSWSSIEDPRYLETLGREFNLLVPGGELAWNWVLRPTRDHYEFSLADQIFQYARQNDMQMRAYLLPTGNSLNDFPDWFLGSGFNKEQMLELVDEHIRTVMGHYAGQVHEWLVTSETIWDGNFVGWNYWLNRYGISFMEHTFDLAHEIDPEATLIYEFDRSEGLGRQSNAIYVHLKDLLERGVPVDAVGFEAHIFLSAPPRQEDVLTNMRRLADLGLDIYIMEMDVNMSDGRPGTTEEELEEQARIYREMLEACLMINVEYDRTVCKSFTLWGFTDAHSWVFYPEYPYGGGEAPLIFDEDYRPKPAYEAMHNLLNEH